MKKTILFLSIFFLCGITISVVINVIHTSVNSNFNINNNTYTGILLVSIVISAIITFRKKKKIKSVIETKREDEILFQDPSPNDDIFLITNITGKSYKMGNPFRGILVIGSAGSGKSISVIRQLIKNATIKGFCGLLYDFKYPTLSDELEGYISNTNNSIKHYNINFTDISKSVRINPLKPEYVINSSFAREYAISIINNLLPESTDKQDFWTRSCIDLLTAEIHYMVQEHPKFSTLPHVVALTYTDEDKLIKLLSQNIECFGMIKSLETALRNNSKNQLSGVIATLQSALSRINIPEIFWILSGDDISLNINDPKNPIWLSVGNNSGLSDTFAPVISLIFTVALKQMNQSGKHKSMVLLDEAPTVFIPNIDRIPATARSNKVSFVFCAQDISQIEKGYGKINTEVLLSNMNNQFYGRLSSPKSAEHVSKMFGRDDYLYTSESESRSSISSYSGSSDNIGQGRSYSYRERDRVRPQELLSFDPGKFAIFLVESKDKNFISMLHKEKDPKVHFDNAHNDFIDLHNKFGLGGQITEISNTNKKIDFKDNFKAIYDQVKEIVAGNEKNLNIPPNDSEFLKFDGIDLKS